MNLVLMFLNFCCVGAHAQVDLKRDVIKSDSAMVDIPELDLELGHGTLGGVYTTVCDYKQELVIGIVAFTLPGVIYCP